MDLENLAHQVGELAQRTRLNAINLAVAAAKVKLKEPAFREANERIIELVTRATEVAGRVDRLTRQLDGHVTDEPVEPGARTLEELEDCMRDVEQLSSVIMTEVRRLQGQTSAGVSPPGTRG